MCMCLYTVCFGACVCINVLVYVCAYRHTKFSHWLPWSLMKSTTSYLQSLAPVSSSCIVVTQALCRRKEWIKTSHISINSNVPPEVLPLYNFFNGSSLLLVLTGQGWHTECLSPCVIHAYFLNCFLWLDETTSFSNLPIYWKCELFDILLIKLNKNTWKEMVSSISCSHRGDGKWDHAEPLSTPNRCSVIYIWPGSILKYPKN